MLNILTLHLDFSLPPKKTRDFSSKCRFLKENVLGVPPKMSFKKSKELVIQILKKFKIYVLHKILF